VHYDPTNLTPDSPTLSLLADALAHRLRQEGNGPRRIDPDADLIELGLIDSQGLLDMILDVEQVSGRMFDADDMDFEYGVTLRRLAAAFSVPV
jgi:acyl carrier protein